MTALATASQCADFIFGDPTATGSLPTDITRLIERASELVLDETRAAVYAVDSQGNATADLVVQGLARAVCAQVEYWLAGDEEDDTLGPVESMSTGGQSQGFGGAGAAGRTTPMYLAPRAARHLRLAGLLSAAVTSG